MKKRQGISLIVLIITIVVIIILAAAIINTVINSGLISNSKRAVNEYNDKVFEEQVELLVSDYQMEKNLNGKNITEFFEEKIANGEIKSFEEKNDIYRIQIEDISIFVDKETGKVMGNIEQSVLNEIRQMKQEFDESGITIEMLTSNSIVSSESEIQQYVPSYSATNYAFNIKKYNYTVDNKLGDPYLVCVESTNMTKNKIVACEFYGIYLLADMNRDHIVDDYDIEVVYSYIGAGIPLNYRQKIVGDANDTGYINLNDVNTIRFKWVNTKIAQAVEQMKQEYDEIMGNEGENRVNITTSDYIEIQKYIPSYTDTRYNLGIIRGNLICLTKTGMTSIRLSNCEGKNIYLLGDIDENSYIDDYDVKLLQEYILGTYTPAGETLTRFLVVSDINGDGNVNNDDLEILKTMASD